MYNLILGDCLTEMKDIPTGSIDMILCDLPYGTTARNKWDTVLPLDALWEQYNRIITEHGMIALFADGLFMADLMNSNKKMWRYNLIWHKTTPTGFLNANRMPLRAHENICCFYKKIPIYIPQKTTVDVTPKDAIITVTDVDGETIDPVAGNSKQFLLSGIGDTYTVTVTKTGYTTEAKQVKNTGDQTLTIVMKASA